MATAGSCVYITRLPRVSVVPLALFQRAPVRSPLRQRSRRLDGLDRLFFYLYHPQQGLVVSLPVIPILSAHHLYRHADDAPWPIRRPCPYEETAVATGSPVIAIVNNRAVVFSPWNTWLMTEENWHFYFGTCLTRRDSAGRCRASAAHREIEGGVAVPGLRSGWSRHVGRFIVVLEPNALIRFCWMVEVDPLDSNSTPVKLTALCRFRHAGALNELALNCLVAVYSGDDDFNAFVYKFVSKGLYDLSRPRRQHEAALRRHPLVASFAADDIKWLPLVHGQRSLSTRPTALASRSDVLIDTGSQRRSSSPFRLTTEDLRVGFQEPRYSVSYQQRLPQGRRGVRRQSARAQSAWAHLLDDVGCSDAGVTKFRWSVLVLCGDPAKPELKAKWHPETIAHGWFAAPDNITFDPSGRIWISTDQGTS